MLDKPFSLDYWGVFNFGMGVGCTGIDMCTVVVKSSHSEDG